jgi:hypothetical protein
MVWVDTIQNYYVTSCANYCWVEDELNSVHVAFHPLLHKGLTLKNRGHKFDHKRAVDPSSPFIGKENIFISYCKHIEL